MPASHTVPVNVNFVREKWFEKVLTSPSLMLVSIRKIGQVRNSDDAERDWSDVQAHQVCDSMTRHPSPFPGKPWQTSGGRLGIGV